MSAAVSFLSADYELRWPRELVVRELAGLRADPDARQRQDRITFLLEEVFLGETPAHDFTVAASRRPVLDDPWGTPPVPPDVDLEDEQGFLDRLIAELPQLREHHEPAPYWPARHGRQHAVSSTATAAQRFAALIRDLHTRGYFDRTLPPLCVDDRDPIDESAVLAERLGLPELWPLRPENWDEDTFFGLVEVFHDLAVRPRERNLHSYNGCGWHYSGFGTDTGRARYRWRVNRLLASAGVGLRLAEDGEDTGRLVRTVDDARTDLVERALAAPSETGGDRVQHAIARFRQRGATAEDKRMAVIALFGVLEQRSVLLKATEQITSKDESDLFNIANNFALRHHDVQQKRDYDPIFLDWMFWWYLAAIEVTNQVLARDRATTPATS